MSRQQIDIETAWTRIGPHVGKQFKDFVPEETMTLMRRNKGRAGQLMEQAIGIPQGNWLLDFSNGDLKTYKSDARGNPMETMAIHQVGSEVDHIVSRQPFAQSSVHLKTQRLIVVGVCKEPLDPADWFISARFLVDARPGTYWYTNFEHSYNQILDQFHRHIGAGGRFHTSNNQFIQLRTKDSQPYTPLRSTILGRQLCDKNIAFYFRKTFMETLRRAR